MVVVVDAKKWFVSVALFVLFRIVAYDLAVDEHTFVALTEKETIDNKWASCE
jgi:hypothetical protein